MTLCHDLSLVNGLGKYIQAHFVSDVFFMLEQFSLVKCLEVSKTFSETKVSNHTDNYFSVYSKANISKRKLENAKELDFFSEGT